MHIIRVSLKSVSVESVAHKIQSDTHSLTSPLVKLPPLSQVPRLLVPHNSGIIFRYKVGFYFPRCPVDGTFQPRRHYWMAGQRVVKEEPNRPREVEACKPPYNYPTWSYAICKLSFRVCRHTAICISRGSKRTDAKKQVTIQREGSEAIAHALNFRARQIMKCALCCYLCL